jgi:nitrate reductase gamma subunit
MISCPPDSVLYKKRMLWFGGSLFHIRAKGILPLHAFRHGLLGREGTIMLKAARMALGLYFFMPTATGVLGEKANGGIPLDAA